jgi:hypothetical protein
MNYRELFEKEYKAEHNRMFQHIKKHFIKYKNQKRSYTYVSNTILEEIKKARSNAFDTDDVVLRRLYDTYYRSYYTYEDGFFYLVFENELYDEYKSIENKIDLSYKTIIQKLASYSAIDAIHPLIKDVNFKPYWFDLYNSLNFNHIFDVFKDFNYYQFRKDGILKILEKLRADIQIEAKSKSKNKSELNNQKYLDKSKLKIIKEYQELFERDDFINFILVNFFEDEISHDDFKDVFIKGKLISTQFKFTEDNYYAQALFYTFQNEFYKNFEIKKFLELQNFYTNTAKRLNKDDLKTYKRRYNKKLDKNQHLEDLMDRILAFKNTMKS